MSDMKHYLIAGVVLVLATIMVWVWTGSAASRYERSLGEDSDDQTAVASAANEEYCNAHLKKVLKRVLTSCGLVKEGGGRGRGCQPLEAKSIAAMAGSDFNALFKPLADRAAIIQFDKADAMLDDGGSSLLEAQFGNRRGASYYLVVSRASPEGSAKYNRDLSQKRAEAVLNHLKSVFKDPEIEREIGLLWLGEEFAQLETEFCQWKRSRPDAPCNAADLNRSAFTAWIDCRL